MMALIIWLIFIFVAHVVPLPAKRAASLLPIQPPSYPLAVRSPYLSAWLPGSDATSIATSQAQFWEGQTLGWTVVARVGGSVYGLFGNPGVGTSATLQTAQYTSTHSYFTLAAGDAVFLLDFFSPVSPKNYVRQSLPFSYLTVSYLSTSSADVQIYSDIDGAWNAGSNADASTWTSTTTNETTHFEIRLNDVSYYSERSDMALWGQAVYASRPNSSSTLTVQTGSADSVRSQFVESGKLTGDQPAWSSGGVVALAHDLGTASTGAAVTFAVGHQRNLTINYLGNEYTSYYRSEYETIGPAVDHFLDDYEDALAEAAALDAAVESQAKEVSGDKYSDYVTLSLRQAFGAIEITVPNANFSTTDALAFIKEISSNGNLNTVDIIFPAFPIYYATNPDLIPLLLEPMMRYLAAGRWPHDYIIHDMGTHYPQAIGHDDGEAEEMPLEESGNLIMLAYAYQLATNDTAWAESYRSIFTEAATYLQNNGWYPAYQYATTDAAGKASNQTILAIKSALALVAYDKLFSVDQFAGNGSALAAALYDGALGTSDDRSHWDLSYLEDDTWMGAYNLYMDKLLALDVFPAEAYDMQSTFLPTKRADTGIPLDSRVTWSKTDWNNWVLAISSDDTRELYVNDTWSYVSNGKNDVPLADRYYVSGASAGLYQSTKNRPTVGAHFALLALKQGPGSLLK